jgi:hypothetical protein
VLGPNPNRRTPRRSQQPEPSPTQPPPGSERDFFAEAAAIRHELNESAVDGDVDLPWLADLDKNRRELDANFLSLVCVDNAPGLILEANASNVIREIQGDETLVDIGTKMVATGFDGIHRTVAEEGRLLEERLAILKQIRETLVQHRSDYRADMETDDYDLDMGRALEMRPTTVPFRKEGRSPNVKTS